MPTAWCSAATLLSPALRDARCFHCVRRSLPSSGTSPAQCCLLRSLSTSWWQSCSWLLTSGRCAVGPATLSGHWCIRHPTSRLCHKPPQRHAILNGTSHASDAQTNSLHSASYLHVYAGICCLPQGPWTNCLLNSNVKCFTMRMPASSGLLGAAQCHSLSC